MKTKSYICILCPNSCTVTIGLDGGRIVNINGYQCERGREWAIQEISDPRRCFVGSVTVRCGDFETVSVKSSGFVPLEEMKKVGILTHHLEIEAPVRMHQVVASDILGLEGVDLIATREVRRVEECS